MIIPFLTSVIVWTSTTASNWLWVPDIQTHWHPLSNIFMWNSRNRKNTKSGTILWYHVSRIDCTIQTTEGMGLAIPRLCFCWWHRELLNGNLRCDRDGVVGLGTFCFLWPCRIVRTQMACYNIFAINYYFTTSRIFYKDLFAFLNCIFTVFYNKTINPSWVSVSIYSTGPTCVSVLYLYYVYVIWLYDSWV